MPRSGNQKRKQHLKLARQFASSALKRKISDTKCTTPPSASRRKIQLLADDTVTEDAISNDADARNHAVPDQMWCIVNMLQLNKLFEKLLCAECQQSELEVRIVKGENYGFSSKLSLTCNSPDCDYIFSAMSSPRVGDKGFEINTRLVMFSHEVGGSLAVLEKFGAVMGIPPMSLRTYQDHDKRVTENVTGLFPDEDIKSNNGTKSKNNFDYKNLFGMGTLLTYTLYAGLLLFLFLLSALIICLCTRTKLSRSKPLTVANVEAFKIAQSKHEGKVNTAPGAMEQFGAGGPNDPYNHKKAIMAKFMFESNLWSKQLKARPHSGDTVINVIEERRLSYDDPELEFDSVSLIGTNPNANTKLVSFDPEHLKKVNLKRKPSTAIPVIQASPKPPPAPPSFARQRKKSSSKKRSKSVTMPDKKKRTSTPVDTSEIPPAAAGAVTKKKKKKRKRKKKGLQKDGQPRQKSKTNLVSGSASVHQVELSRSTVQLPAASRSTVSFAARKKKERKKQVSSDMSSVAKSPESTPGLEDVSKAWGRGSKDLRASKSEDIHRPTRGQKNPCCSLEDIVLYFCGRGSYDESKRGRRQDNWNPQADLAERYNEPEVVSEGVTEDTISEVAEYDESDSSGSSDSFVSDYSEEPLGTTLSIFVGGRGNDDTGDNDEGSIIESQVDS